MKNIALFLSLILLSQIILIEQRSIESSLKEANGGVNCAVCSVLLTLVDELAVVYNDSIQVSLNKFCQYLPDGIFRVTCKEAVKTFGPVIIDG